MKISDKIKGYKKEILEEVMGKVYKISTTERNKIKEKNPNYNCDCSFTLEEAVELQRNVSLTDINMVLRPYEVCEFCKDQMKRQIGTLGAVIAAIENDGLDVDPMGTVKKTGGE